MWASVPTVGIKNREKLQLGVKNQNVFAVETSDFV
jgi:hypothetical protein